MEKEEGQLLFGPSNVSFIESMYRSYLRDPSSVSEDWRRYFANWGNGDAHFEKPRFGPSFRARSIFSASAGRAIEADTSLSGGHHHAGKTWWPLYRVFGDVFASVR